MSTGRVHGRHLPSGRSWAVNVHHDYGPLGLSWMSLGYSGPLPFATAITLDLMATWAEAQAITAFRDCRGVSMSSLRASDLVTMRGIELTPEEANAITRGGRDPVDVLLAPRVEIRVLSVQEMLEGADDG